MSLVVSRDRLAERVGESNVESVLMCTAWVWSQQTVVSLTDYPEMFEDLNNLESPYPMNVQLFIERGIQLYEFIEDNFRPTQMGVVPYPYYIDRATGIVVRSDGLEDYRTATERCGHRFQHDDGSVVRCLRTYNHSGEHESPLHRWREYQIGAMSPLSAMNQLQ